MLTWDFNIAYTRRRFIRPLVDDDGLEQLAEMERECFAPPENYDHRTLRMLLSLNGVGLLRCYDDNHAQQLLAFQLVDCLNGELITLDVHPSQRRKGLGRLLLTESMRKLKELGHQRITCQIAVDNDISLKLHRDVGFRTVKKIRNYYGPGRDAYVMSAKLKGK